MSVDRRDPTPDLDLAAELRAEDASLDLSHYWWLLWRRRWLVGLFFVAVVLSVASVTFLLVPLYSAESVLMIESQSPQVLDIEEVLSESLLGSEHDYYKTQYELLKSRSLAEQVIRTEQLTWSDLSPPRFLISWAEDSDEAPARGSEIDPDWIDAYLARLAIAPLDKTHLVKVHFSSPDPELAARVVNAHARAYISRGLAFRNRASEDARRFLDEKLIELHERLRRSEAALNRYRSTEGIVSLDEKENMVVERLADLNRRMTEVEAQRIGYEAQFQVARRGDPNALSAVTKSDLISTLKEEIALLESQHSELSAQFNLNLPSARNPNRPRLEQLEARIEDIRRHLRRETSNIVNGIESALLKARAEEEALTEKLAEQKAAALRLKSSSVDYAILAREVETTRQLHEAVLLRVKETGLGAGLQSSNVFVIDPARAPLEPISPRVGRNIALAILMGLLGGLALVLAADYLDNTLRSPEDAEHYLQLPSLGFVPDFRALGSQNQPQIGGEQKLLSARASRWNPLNGERRRPSPSLQRARLQQNPFSVASEAYRAVRTSLLLSKPDEAPRVIAFTSARTSEGKTATVLNMAAAFAQLGRRVLVIDADLRRPDCQRILATKSDLGLTEVLTGQPSAEGRLADADARQAVLRTRWPFFFLPSGQRPPDPTELLGSARMRELLASLRKRFEYILIDSPPLAPVSDGLVLSTLVDGVVLVIDQQNTPRQLAREVLSRLDRMHVRPLGFVLNRVTPHSGSYMDVKQYYA
jgi:capsular exopolysaccharide synthesis family protein